MEPTTTRPATDAGEGTSDGPRDLRDVTVLLVEDDPEDRRLFSQQIEAAGPHPDVLSVETVGEAIEHLDGTADVDVVLLDLGLPDSKGLDTLDAVTATGTPVPVIVLTGRGNDPELAVAALRRGAHEYLVKGELGAGELARVIRDAIERHQLQRDTATLLLHQEALLQLETTGGATADLQGLARAAVSAVQVGLDLESVSVRFAGDSLPGVAAATVVGDLLAPGELDVEGDVTTTVELRGDAGPVGRIDVPVTSDGGLTTHQRRFLATAAAAITARVERLVADLELKARTRQLDTVQRVAAQLQRELDPGAAVARVAALLVEGLRGRGDLGVTVEVEGHVVTAGSHVGSGAVVAETPVTVRGDELGSIALLRDAEHALGPEERTVLDGVAAQLGTWWALARADHDHRRDLDRIEERSAEELRRVSELKDGFLRALSHELRTPLAAIVGFVETLREHGADLDPSQTSTMLERLDSNAQRLGLLVEDLLDVGRLTAGVRSTLQRTEHDLSELVMAIVELLPTTEHGLALHLERTPTHVDRPKVERIIHNLMGNAIRHTPRGTTISVTTRRQADAAVLIVDDDGPGIPTREWDAVFEPFVQGDRAASSASPGTGVGLSLVRRFVELHDGTVDLDVGPSGGARFTVVLPDRV